MKLLFACVFASLFLLPPSKPATTVLPRPSHIIIVMEENHSFDQIIGSKYAPYINELAKESALFTDAHGVQHPSQPNYIALFSGNTQGVKDDKCLKNVTFTSANLGAYLIKAGHSFGGFAQTMPTGDFTGCYYQKSTITKSYLYGRKHCPWVNWIGTKTNQLPVSVSKPMTEFPIDFSKLPTVCFVIPDMDHDMHNIGSSGDGEAIRRGDQWLKQNLSKYVEWAKKNNSLLIFTFDEDDFKAPNHIPTFFVGPMVKPGRYTQRIDHYNVLRTIEALYRLPASGNAKADAITDIWKN